MESENKNTNPSENFDLEAVYDEQVFPLMAQILEICKANRMPMLATFLYKRTDTGGEDEDMELCTSFLGSEAMDRGRCRSLVRALAVVHQGDGPDCMARGGGLRLPPLSSRPV